MGTARGRDFSRLRSRLEGERRARAGEIGRQALGFCGDARVKELSVGDEGDQAAFLLLEQLAHLEQRRAFSALRSVENAIRTIDAGRYGHCQLCGEPIPARRLRILPTAIFCVACQAAAETGRPVGGTGAVPAGTTPQRGGALTERTRPAHAALMRRADHGCPARGNGRRVMR